MLRIILIGNGFDLAHGYKTRYSDFIEWYWKKKFNEVLGKCKSSKIDEAKDILKSDGINLVQDSLQYECDEFNVPLREYKDVEDMRKYLTYKNHLLETIQNNIEEKNWSDIEADYRVRLEKTNNVNNENDDLESIRQCLLTYLNGINEFIGKTKVSNIFQNDIIEKICANDETVEKYILLSLNYTQTASMYASKLMEQSKNVQCIYLHGDIKQPETILFGDGKDISLNGSLAAEKDNTAYDVNSKRNYYQNSGNMKILNEEMSENEYEVFIMGHSCGKSDNCLMNKLFSNPNCKKIKIIHIGEKDYNEKLNNFKNQNIKLALIDTYSPIDNMPQNGEFAFEGIKFVFVEGDASKGIKSFWMSKNPITTKVWKNHMEIKDIEIIFNHFCTDDAPIGCVHIDRVKEFIEKIKVSDSVVFRLPTENEWRYAAKGGKKSKGYKYSGSNNIDEVAWYIGNTQNQHIHDIEGKKPNELGLYDMSGNICELCIGEDGSSVALGGMYCSSSEECAIDSVSISVLSGGFRLIF